MIYYDAGDESAFFLWVIKQVGLCFFLLFKMNHGKVEDGDEVMQKTLKISF
jgi:hypothetical protein